MDDHLSRISTVWSQIFAAHDPESPEIRRVQGVVWDRYSGAVYRYLLSLLRDDHAADEVFQELALQWVRGGFRHADPSRGRFRDYLKRTVVHAVSKYRRQVTRNAAGGSSGPPELVAAEAGTPTAEQDAAFLASVREEFLQRAWTRLERFERDSDRPWFTVLKYRARHPEATSQEMAEAMHELWQRQPPWGPAAVRKILQRAREHFAELLLDEIEATLDSPSLEQLEQELIDLGLFAYCRSALETRRRDA